LLAKAVFDYSPECGLHERVTVTDQGIDTNQSNTAISEADSHRFHATMGSVKWRMSGLGR